jgi:NADPH2:quinone reductase
MSTLKSHAIRIHRFGGPDVLQWEEIEVGEPGPGQLRLRQKAIGLNFIDTYHRTGLYPNTLPITPGMEGAGTVEAIGPDVTEYKVGDRVAYPMALGSYAEIRLIGAKQVVKIPDGIPEEHAATLMLQGLTAQYLLRQVYPVKPGDTVLFHAAAGGVGLIFCQWAAHLGATVIGTVGSDEKAEIAKAHGCRHAIVYTREDFQARVMEITGGQKLPVVYDGIGQDTFDKSLDCLRPLGLMVSFGNSSGPVPPVDLLKLAQRGSLMITRPTLATFSNNPPVYREMAAELFDLVQRGVIKTAVNQRYALKDAGQAHADLEARKTTGSTVLLA